MADLSREYGISKSTVTVWINKLKPIVDDNGKDNHGWISGNFKETSTGWRGKWNILKKTAIFARK